MPYSRLLLAPPQLVQSVRQILQITRHISISLTLYILYITYITRIIYISFIFFFSSILTFLYYNLFPYYLLILYLSLYLLSISYRQLRLQYKGFYKYRIRLSRLSRISIKLIESIDFIIIIIFIIYISTIKFAFYNYIVFKRALQSFLIIINNISLREFGSISIY